MWRGWTISRSTREVSGKEGGSERQRENMWGGGRKVEADSLIALVLFSLAVTCSNTNWCRGTRCGGSFSYGRPCEAHTCIAVQTWSSTNLTFKCNMWSNLRSATQGDHRMRTLLFLHRVTVFVANLCTCANFCTRFIVFHSEITNNNKLWRRNFFLFANSA